MSDSVTPRKTSGFGLSDLADVEGFDYKADKDTVFGLTLNEHGTSKRKEIKLPIKFKWWIDISIDNFSVDVKDDGDVLEIEGVYLVHFILKLLIL